MTAEAGAKCSDFVHQYCPIALVTPLNSIRPASCQLGVTIPNGRRQAKKIVKNHGFYNVFPTDCDGNIMRFKGKKFGDWYRIKVNHAGNIVDVDHL